jgi:hypothetical protein
VVINPRDVETFFTVDQPGRNIGSEFAVMGVIDLAAVPPEKAHLPLGDDDNPIPLVEFIYPTAGEYAGSKQPPSVSSKSHTRKKRPKPARLQAKQRKKKKRRK